MSNSIGLIHGRKDNIITMIVEYSWLSTITVHTYKYINVLLPLLNVCIYVNTPIIPVISLS